MTSLKSTNLGFLSAVIIGVITSFVVYRLNQANDPGGLGAAMIAFITFGILITWPIVLLINYRAAKQAPRVLSPAEMERYKRNRILVVIGLIIFFLSPFLFGH